MAKQSRLILRACSVGIVLGMLSCKDPGSIDVTPQPPDELEDCPASAEWLPNTPEVTMFTPAPHPTTECPFYRGVWQNFLLAPGLNSTRIHSNENHDDNPNVDLRGHDLHEFFCGGKTKLQENSQELPDERQEGMQLR